jgi:EmrB/QacA subfamily drug resistance transporter
LENTRGYRFRWVGLVFVSLSVLIISLDNTILNAAIPSISRQLGATTNELQWVVDGYVLVFAALLLSAGAIGDRFGRKRVLQIGLIWFALDSLLSANANSTGMLIASRALLGIGGALILPATLSTVTATFPLKERPQAISIWAAIFGLGVGLGPLIGGFLLDHFAWNSVFLINIPVAIIAFIGGALYLNDTKDSHPPALDYPGVLLSIAGLFVLVYGIIEAGVRGWTDSTVLLSLGAGIGLLAAFGWWEARTPNAMLPMRFFRNPSFSVASLVLSMVLFCQFGVFFFMSLYLQTVQGYSTFAAGIRLLPLAVAMMSMATLSPGLTHRFGIKRMVAFGVGTAAIALLFMALMLHPDSAYPLVFIGQLVLGLGIGLTFSPATNSIMGAVPLNKLGVGSAMNDTTRQVGGALGVAVMGTVLNQGYATGIIALKSAKALSNLPAGDLSKIVTDAQSGIQAAHVLAGTLPAPINQAVIAIANDAFMSGMSHALLLGAFILGLAMLLAIMRLPAQPRRHEVADISKVSPQAVVVPAAD